MTNLEIYLLSIIVFFYLLGQATTAFYIFNNGYGERKWYWNILILLFWLPIIIGLLSYVVAGDIIWPVIRHWYNKLIGDWIECQKCTYDRDRKEILYVDKDGRKWYWEVDSNLGKQILKLNKKLRREICGYRKI